MHVCMLTTTHDIKDDRIYHKEALSLKRQGIDVTILGTGPEVVSEADGINLISLPRGGGLWSRLKVLGRLAARAEMIDCDAYQFHEPELLWVGRRLQARTGRRVIFDAHEHYPDMMLNTTRLPGWLKLLAAWGMDRWERWFVPGMDQIITADDNIEKRYSKLNRNVTTIFNYPVTDLFYKAKPDPEFMARYAGRDIVIYEGGIARVRGPLELLAAVNQVRKTHPNIMLVFVGPFSDQQCKADMEHYITENDLAQWVDMVGPVPHEKVPGYVAAAKAGLVTLLPVPKFYKNIPIKQFEYMACGIPVVGSDLPPIRSYVEKARCGLIVDPTRPEQIANAIRYLLDHPAEAEEMGMRGQEAVAKDWNWEQMGRKLADLYHGLSRNRAKAGV